MSKPLTEMTKAQLKKYLSENSNDNEKCSQAMQVLLSKMSPQENWIPPFDSFEDGAKFFNQKK